MEEQLESAMNGSEHVVRLQVVSSSFSSMLRDKAVPALARAGLNFDVYQKLQYAFRKWKPHQGVGISNSASYQRHRESDEKSLDMRSTENKFILRKIIA